MPALRPEFTDLDLTILLSGNIPASKVIGGQQIPTGGAAFLSPPDTALGVFIFVPPSVNSTAYVEIRFPDIDGGEQIARLQTGKTIFFLGNYNFLTQFSVDMESFVGSEVTSAIFF
jgi:hypothetical protein